MPYIEVQILTQYKTMNRRLARLTCGAFED